MPLPHCGSTGPCSAILTREEVLQRMRNQIDEEIKMMLCDAVIQNDGQQALMPQVLALHERLLQQAATAVITI
jgi:dephospho-CoA kinase